MVIVKAAAVFTLAVAAFSFNLWKTNIGSGWIDPLRHYGAQDESTYTHVAIRMVQQGDWINPKLLGRYYLEKPPLLVWLSAISMKALGIGSFTPRLPAVLSGALLASLCYLVARAARSPQAGVAGALLCISNQLLFSMARHNMTDILLTASVVAALAALAADPALVRQAPAFVFVLAITAGILTKSIAGVLPALAALLFAALVIPYSRQVLLRIAVLTAVAVLLASPWFLYQLSMHRSWFLADVQFQIVKVGFEQPTSLGHHLRFYSSRLMYAAPIALLLGISGLPRMFSSLRRRETVPLLLACFFAVLCGALLAFGFESEPYLAPLLPIVILIAAISSPLLARPFGGAVCILILIAFTIKVAYPNRPWGLSYDAGSTFSNREVLSSYCEQRRDNALFIVGVEDQFYALALPLARVRYGWVEPAGEAAKLRPHLRYLGIIQEAGERSDLESYATRLRAWGLNSTEPLGTGVTGQSVDDFAAFVGAHPESDFLVSPAIAAKLGSGQIHDVRRRTPDSVLLESRVSHPAAAAGWTCGM